MTALARKVRRETPSTPRPLIVSLIPPGIIEVREKGRRAGFSLTVGSLYVILAERAASARKRRVRGSLVRGAR